MRGADNRAKQIRGEQRRTQKNTGFDRRETKGVRARCGSFVAVESNGKGERTTTAGEEAIASLCNRPAFPRTTPSQEAWRTSVQQEEEKEERRRRRRRKKLKNPGLHVSFRRGRWR
jgi:hypothetical protein